MISATRLPLIAALLLSVPLAGCVAGRVTNDVPHCERLIPEFLLKPIDHWPVPDGRKFPDGHDDAQPWQEGFVGEGGQLDKANDRTPAVDHIYRTCLDMHREALKKAQGGFFARIFG